MSRERTVSQGRIYKHTSKILDALPESSLGVEPRVVTHKSVLNPFTGLRKRVRSKATATDTEMPAEFADTSQGRAFKRLKRLEFELDSNAAMRAAHRISTRFTDRVLRIETYNVFLPKGSRRDSEWMFRMQLSLFSICGKRNVSLDTIAGLSQVVERVTVDIPKATANGSDDESDSRHSSVSALSALSSNAKSEHSIDDASESKESQLKDTATALETVECTGADLLRTDGIEIKRKGTKECDLNIRIWLRQSENEPLYSMSVALGSLLGFADEKVADVSLAKEDESEDDSKSSLRKKTCIVDTSERCKTHLSKSEILHSICELIKLQRSLSRSPRNDAEVEDGNGIGMALTIDCQPLRELLLATALTESLASPLLHWGNVWALLIETNNVCTALPLQLTHTVKVKGRIEANTGIHECIVRVPNTALLTRLESTVETHRRQVEDCDSRIKHLIAAIEDCRKDATFYGAYATQPLKCIADMEKAQSTNLQTMTEFFSETRPLKSDCYSQKWAADALRRIRKEETGKVLSKLE